MTTQKKKAYPAGLPRRYRWAWDHPWRVGSRRNYAFRRWLDRNGYLSPHFRTSEARCKDGTNVTGVIKRRARKHAFALEKFRHRIGDKPVQIISWYRTPHWNVVVGGAKYSQHMNGWATDHPKEWVDRVGRAKVMREARYVFHRFWKGGIGVYPWGSLHLDSRGWVAEWNDWGRRLLNK